MAVNVAQFERNLEAIQFGQQAQSTYEQPPNPALAFASASLNVANTYYSMEFQKQQAGLLTNAEKRALRKRNPIKRTMIFSTVSSSQYE